MVLTARAVGISLLLLGTLATSPSQAQWLPYGTPLSTNANMQDQVSAAPDGAGGMIVAWRDLRTDGGDIYAQRISGTGFPLWAAGGVPVCTAADRQFLPQIVTDGAGGAILAWQDNRSDPNGDIYAQRVDPGGTRLWLANGVPLVTGASQNIETISRFRMIPDGVGGAIMTFSDNRFAGGGFDPLNPKVWGQRVTSFGSPLWSPGGVPVAAGAGSYENASLAPDGYGGIIVAWSDDSAGDWNISAQHIDPAGVALWGPGVVLCGVPEKQLYPEAVPDGSGGAIVVWQDNRFDTNGDIYGQRIDASGTTLWVPDGNALVFGASANNSGDYIIRMIRDGGDGVTFAFADDRKPSGIPDPGLSKVWAQRVDLAGFPQWGSGVPVSSGTGVHSRHQIVSDTEGGSIVVWEEGSIASATNIFAQRFDPFGGPQWGPGVSVCNGTGLQSAPAAVADGLGGVLAAWTDARTDAGDVYAQYVDFTGVPSSNARWECSSWRPDGARVVQDVNLQSDPAAAPDGAGGSIIVWRDERADTGNVYVQRMSSLGAPLWDPAGVPVCVQLGLQQEPRIISDGVGGAIIVWQDNRLDPIGDMYAQRVDAKGNILWALNGVPVVSGPSNNVQSPATFRMISDGVGGVILTFSDTRRSDGVIDGVPKVWAQRVDGSGAPLWGNGVAVTTISGNQMHGAPVSDGAGGVIVTWMQVGVGVWDIWGQRVDAAGTRRWGASIFICNFAGNQYYPDITSDGAGGAIVSWLDLRVDVNADIYAQKVNPLGGVLWAANGVPLITGPTHNYVPGLENHIQMIPDNAGGAILAVIDTRDTGGIVGVVPKIWAQQVKASGAAGWGNGVPAAAGAGSHFYHSIVTDGEGGAVVVWQENPFGSWNIAAQRFSPGGGPYWIAGGVPVSDEVGNQTRPAVTTDGRGHAIAAWSDSRLDVGDIYAERICVGNRMTTAVADEPAPDAPALLGAPAPNPTAEGISYTLHVREPGRVRVYLADVRGIVATLLDRNVAAGPHRFAWSGRVGERDIAAGVYFITSVGPEGRSTRKLVVLR